MYYHRPNSAHIHSSALDIDQWLSLLRLTEDNDIPLPYLLQKIVNLGMEVKCQLDVNMTHEGLVSMSPANITKTMCQSQSCLECTPLTCTPTIPW